MARNGDCRCRAARACRAEAAARNARARDQDAACRRLQRPPRKMTIEEFARRLRAHEITSEQVTDECLHRIDAENSRLNAFILVMAHEARQQARDADGELAAGRDRGPLHGVPISLKDLLDVKGVPTTAASRVREG